MKAEEKLKSSQFTRNDILTARNEMFGFAAIWIILFHVYGHVKIGMLPGVTRLESYVNLGLFWLGKFLNMGNGSVDVFLLLSAVGLYASMEKNSAGRFYKNRLSRVAVPFLLAAVPYFVWYDFCFAGDGTGQFLLNVSTLNFWLTNSYPVWYVAFIAVIYALYPLLYRLDRKTNHLGIFALMAASVLFEYVCYRADSVIYANAEKALSRIPVFLAGILLAPHLLHHRDKKLPACWVAAAAAVWLAAFYGISMYLPHLIITRYLYGVMAVCFVAVFSWIRKYLPCRPVNRLMAWLGGRSLEIYVVHVLLLQIVKCLGLWNLELPRWAWYAAIAGISIIMAEGLSCLAKTGRKLLPDLEK